MSDRTGGTGKEQRVGGFVKNRDLEGKGEV